MLNWEKQESSLIKKTAEEQKGLSVVTVYITTVFLGILPLGFVN